MTLSGKTVLVAGAGGRLGRASVEAILAAGANVVALDHSPAALMGLAHLSENPALRTQVADISDVASVSAAFELAEKEFGALHGAVNSAYPRNAAYGASFFEVTRESFSENLGLHLGGYFIFMQQCALLATRTGDPFSLVNMSSIYGSVAPRFDIYSGTTMTMPVEYAAIKAGLEHITRYANAFCQGSRFRANCVSPGGILDGQPAAFLEKYHAHTRHKGMLDPRDIIGTVLFLLSDASEFLIGQNIIVDDGFSL